MRRTCVRAVLSGVLAWTMWTVAGVAAEQPADRAAKAKARRDALLAPVPDIPGLPRVLLIGDSISIGYTARVREALAGVANVHRPPDNCRDTRYGLEQLERWLGDKPWHVIHFNFGLHDLKYTDGAGELAPPDRGRLVATPETYAANLREIVARLKRTGARLIFATTTPVPPGASGRIAGSEMRYNEAAAGIMREEGVALNDLHAFLGANPQARPAPNDVHFTSSGSAALGDVVAERIRAALPSPRAAPGTTPRP